MLNIFSNRQAVYGDFGFVQLSSDLRTKTVKTCGPARRKLPVKQEVLTGSKIDAS
jgi:hypothetical protein